MQRILGICVFFTAFAMPAKACSILYYIDSASGKIYAVNNEDYWYSVKPYIRIMPHTSRKLARLWYGWANFAQGLINESVLFFDGASTPEQQRMEGYSRPKHNLGDEILARCHTVSEALDYLEKEKIALTGGHMLFGDRSGHAAVVEWVDGIRKITQMEGNHLSATNFLLADPQKGNYPCPRYEAMETEISRLRQSKDPIDLKSVGNIAAKAVQPPVTNTEGQEGGTLYSTFVNLTDFEFVLIYKLDNARMTKLDLAQEFRQKKRRTIRLE